MSRWLNDVGLRLDRSSDVPVGLQLAWGLRAAIELGFLQPGERLPALRDLAEDLGVNPNTVRAVAARLAQDGFLVTRHGSGTFVADDPPGHDGLDAVLATARRAAATAGIPARDLAVALWAADGPVTDGDGEAAGRSRIRRDIAVLERLLAERGLSAAPPDPAAPRGPRLLTRTELEAQRDGLIARLDKSRPAPEPPRPGAEARTEAEPRSARGRPRPSTRPALP